MHIDLTSVTVAFVSVLGFIETIQSCNLNCGLGSRCQMTMSTCDYPPCPYFPTCVPHQKHHHRNHNGHHKSATRRHPSFIESILSDSSELAPVDDDVVHPGECPVITIPGPCLQTCRSDGDCPSDRKCCYNGCGNTCRSVTENISSKPGTCPRHIASMTVHCTDNCDIDLDCPGVQKCCKSRCGSHCTDPCYYWLRPNQRSARKSIVWKLPFMCRN